MNASGSEVISGRGGIFPETSVLVVDDEPLIRWSLKESLSRQGYQVLEAQDAKTALTHVRATGEHIDVVLLDLRLPDTSDLSCLQAIKRLRPDCQVILMTAFGSPELADEAVQYGAYRVVSKPFSMDDMVTQVSQALASRGPTH